MSRDDTSLPTVWPTISPALLITSASSGSGTFHLLSSRTRIGMPWPATRQPIALKNSSGRFAS